MLPLQAGAQRAAGLGQYAVLISATAPGDSALTGGTAFCTDISPGVQSVRGLHLPSAQAQHGRLAGGPLSAAVPAQVVALTVPAGTWLCSAKAVLGTSCWAADTKASASRPRFTRRPQKGQAAACSCTADVDVLRVAQVHQITGSTYMCRGLLACCQHYCILKPQERTCSARRLQRCACY